MTSSWMLVASFLFSASSVFVKLGAEHFDGAELAFYRSFFMMIAAFPVVVRGGTLKTPYIGPHMVRSLVGAVGLIGYFYAITKLPLATAQTLNYTSPIFLAIATTVVLGERFSPWLIVAIVLGFVGVAFILEPSFAQGTEGPAMIGLFSGVLSAWAYLAVRTLGRLGEPDWRVVFWFGTVGSVICAAWQLATRGFHRVGWDNAWIILGLGVCGYLAQLTMTRAYRTGNTLVVGALSYSTIVFASIATLVIWDENVGWRVWIGMAIVAASGILAMRIEKKEKIISDPRVET